MRSDIATIVPLWGTLLFSFSTANAEPASSPPAIIQLLNLFSARSDVPALKEASKLLNEDTFPAKSLESSTHAPLCPPREWPSPESARILALQLGEHVMEHPEDFPGPLPDPSGIEDPLRLEGFFEGLYQPALGSSNSSINVRKELTRLTTLLDDPWLDAAAACGADNLRQLVKAHRGELPQLLLAYQESGDDTAVIQLGETLASHSAAHLQIKAGEFRTRTLALFLAGSLGMRSSNSDERQTIVMTAAGWTREHPDLMGQLDELRGASSVALLLKALLWQKDRETFVKQLGGLEWESEMAQAGFIMKLFEASSLTEAEAVPLLRLMSTGLLEAWSKSAGVGSLEEKNAPSRRWVMAELETRTGRTEKGQ